MTHRRLPCVCVEGSRRVSFQTKRFFSVVVSARRESTPHNSFLFSTKKRFSSQKQNRKRQTFFSATKTPKPQISLSCARTLPAELTHARETTPNEIFKAGRENSRLIDCCWSTFNDRNPIRAGDSRFHTTTQSNSTFINTLRCDSRRSAVLELCVCVLSKFSRPLNAH